MTRVAIMQPYLFPYLGYFQLICAVDQHVFFDNVNFIKGGWINRNYILSNRAKQRVTIPLRGASPNRKINEIEVLGPLDHFLKTIRQSYAKAPNCDTVMALLDDICSFPDRNLANFTAYSLLRILDYVGGSDGTVFHRASRIDSLGPKVKGQERVIALCRKLGATEYVNSPGGRRLYQPERFADASIKLRFLQPQMARYRQGSANWHPGLSIIDVLMFNSPETVLSMLGDYDLD